MDANRGEHEKFEKLTRKFGDLKAAFPYLVEYFGKVQTDLGEGLVFQAIKDFDGSMSKTIESAGEIGGYNKPLLLEAVKTMAATRNDGSLYHDVGENNIVIQLLVPNHEQYKLWVIDGINNRALIPIAEYSTVYANIRKVKKILRLNRYIHKNFKPDNAAKQGAV